MRRGRRRGGPARAFNLYGNGRAGNHQAGPSVTSGGAESHLSGLRWTAIADERDRDGRPGRIEPGCGDQPVSRGGVEIVDLGHQITSLQACLRSRTAAGDFTQRHTDGGRQLGIRTALGARTGDILRLVIVECMSPALVGIAVGVIAALASARLMETLVFGVSPSDPLTLAAVGVTLAIVALMASVVPAYRAVRVDPVTVLRAE